MKKLKIVQDTEAESPTEVEMLFKVVCWHPNCAFGSKVRRDAYDSAEAVLEAFVDEDDRYMHLPLYVYDHGGQTYSTEPFNDRFDSGQAGWVYATKETVAYTYGTQLPEQEALLRMMKDFVRQCSDWGEGHNWGFVIEEVTCCEHCGAEDRKELETLFGFTGDDGNLVISEMREHVPQDLCDQLEEAWEARYA